MKTKLACVLGLAALAASFGCGVSLAHADAIEAASSVSIALASDADLNGAESPDLHCVLYSDGADNCIVNVEVAAADPSSSADSEPSAAAPAIQFADAIAVAVVQTVTIAAPGSDARDSEEPAVTGSIPAPSATEPASSRDAKSATDTKSASDALDHALLAPAAQTGDAIVVAVVQSVTIAVPGQIPDREDMPTGSIAEPMAPMLVLEAKTTVLDHAE